MPESYLNMWLLSVAHWDCEFEPEPQVTGRLQVIGWCGCAPGLNQLGRFVGCVCLDCLHLYYLHAHADTLIIHLYWLLNISCLFLTTKQWCGVSLVFLHQTITLKFYFRSKTQPLYRHFVRLSRTLTSVSPSSSRETLKMFLKIYIKIFGYIL